MTARIGVYVCECGPNIIEALDTGRVRDAAADLEGVAAARSFRLFCAPEGRALIAEDIQTLGLNRVVVAGCSPREHERTFRGVLEKAGLNPYFLQIANIREQCAWVHEDRERATEKAVALVRAAVERAAHHEALESREIECRTDALVVGAGVAGMSAALSLAQRHRRVFLVERSPCIGGRAVRCEDLFPGMECAACVLEPLIDEVLHREEIEVLTLGEVREVLGFWGAFSVRVKQRARFMNPGACLGCRACFDVCPAEAPDEFNEGLSRRKAVYIPYEGALPNVAVIDPSHCSRFRGRDCAACAEACPFDAIDLDQSDREVVLEVGAIVLATGFDLFDPREDPRFGYGGAADVYTALEFERMVNPGGPTRGAIRKRDGRGPGSVAFIHCVGSRSEKRHAHCSGVCCAYLLKQALQTRRRLPEADIHQFYIDFCLPGKKGQGLLNRALEMDRFTLHRLKSPESISAAEADGAVALTWVDPDGERFTTIVDLVVLGPAMIGAASAAPLADLLNIRRDASGFWEEAHPVLDPAAGGLEGVFLAGCGQEPMDASASAARGRAAASRILQELIPGRTLPLEAAAARVDNDRCSGCKTCLGSCEFGALVFDADGQRASVNALLCRGCGVCVPACPCGALDAMHYTDAAIGAEIRGLLGRRGERGGA